jgi:hypothetical protein
VVERREPAGTSAWDSRYGQNYTFDVSREGLPIPKRSVAARPETLIDLSKIRVVEDAATKEEAGSYERAHPAGRARSDGGPGAAADMWADVHVFDAAGELIRARSVAFRPPERTADPALRVWEDEVYQGSGGGSGMGEWSRPDAHTVQYRLYCQVRGQLFTDGVLHQFDVPADEDVCRGPGRG